MKLRTRLAGVVLGGVMLFSLAGCGSISLNLGKGEADRMTAYVQGLLDLTYLGKFNEDYLKETDMTEEEAQETYLQGLEVEAQFFETYVAAIEYPTQESTQRLMDLYKEIYQHSKYTVESATKLESGNYAVEVTVSPIDVMTGLTSDDFNQVFMEVLAEFGVTDEAGLAAMSQEDYEQADQMYAQRVMDLVEDAIPTLGYGEEQSLIVQIQDDGDVWTPVTEDFQAIDAIIIDYSSFSQ